MIVESKHTSCYGCKLNRNNYCYWFDRPKVIPRDVIHKGCKHREAKVDNMDTAKIVAHIINTFNGEIIQ